MLLRGQAVYAPTLMYRTELLNRIGGVPDVLWEDLAVTLRFAAVAQPMFHPEALVEYRVHGGNAHLGIVHARRHFHAHAEAVRSLAEWPALPKEHLTSVHDHLAVLDWLDGYLLGGRRLAELRSLPKQPLELVLRRQASDLVRDLSRGDVHRMEAFLWLFGARRAASALAEVLGAPFWTRATRKITRARR
jgi:hypothetical protein